MISREDFEKAVLKLMPFADVVWSEGHQEYTVPGIQHRWRGYQMRQPEIDALKADIARYQEALIPQEDFTRRLGEAQMEIGALKAEIGTVRTQLIEELTDNSLLSAEVTRLRNQIKGE